MGNQQKGSSRKVTKLVVESGEISAASGSGTQYVRATYCLHYLVLASVLGIFVYCKFCSISRNFVSFSLLAVPGT